MSEDSLIFVLYKTIHKSESDMANVPIKSEQVTPFGGIFSIMEQFYAFLSNVINSTLGIRCQSFGYSYSEIIRSLCAYSFVVVHVLRIYLLIS